MSAAFDTIKREKLLDILKSIINEDELRIIRFLLSNTIIDTKIDGATKKRPFVSNVGTPQGDSLSPVLFTIYLENALKEVRPILPQHTAELEKTLPSEIAYADDVDFIGFDDINIENVQTILKKHNLSVNVDKTEFTKLSRQETAWRDTKKVGTLIGDKEDVERRKQLSTEAIYKLTNVWIKGDKLKRVTKIKLYRALVKSILTYNCGTWALTQTEEEKINAFHRKQLKKVLNIRYPEKITNKSLYKVCNEKPLSITILESRWRLFGHILRRNMAIPANKAMTGYFLHQGDRYRGRPITTLPVVLNRDLARLNCELQLRNQDDLNHLRNIAQQTQQGAEISRGIRDATEASQTEH